MGIKLTQQELDNLLTKNNKLKIADSFGGKKENEKETKVSLDKTKVKKNKIKVSEEEEIKEIKKPKNTGVKTSELNKLNREAKVSFTSSEEHISLAFDGAKLLSVNQIFAILQYRKYEIFSYKKNWHEIIKKVLNEQYLILRQTKKSLPFFEDSVEITLFRQASRLVDEDAMSTMFKYIIDALKRDDDNPHGVLAEDNPKIVHRIVCYSEKGSPLVGIRVQKITEKKQKYGIEDLLKTID